MANLIWGASRRILDDDGDPHSGGKVYVYTAGTTTAVTTYSDSGLSSANAHPVVADASGIVGPIFVADGTYKIRVTDASDVVLYEDDEVETVAPQGFKKTFDTITLLKADTKTYTFFAEDDYIYVTEGAHTYKVAASGATDHAFATAGGVKVYVVPVAGDTLYARAFDVHGDDYASTTDFGTDKATALQNCIDYAIAQGIPNVILPAGKIRLDSKVSNTGNKDIKLRLVGMGQDQTVLLVNGNAQTDGALDLKCTSATNIMEIYISDLSFAAGDMTDADYTAIDRMLIVHHDTGASLRDGSEFIMERVDFIGWDNNQGYAKRPIDLKNLWSAHLKMVRSTQFIAAQTSGDPAYSDRFLDAWEPYLAESALYAENCYGMKCENCMFRGGGADLGVGGGSVGQGGPVFLNVVTAEGTEFRDCTSNMGIIGVRIIGANNEPGFKWIDGHVNARDICFYFADGITSTVEGCLLYLNDGNADIGANADANATPRIFHYDASTGDDHVVRDNYWHYADHTNLSAGYFIWTQEDTAREYYVHGNKINNTISAMARFFYGSPATKHVVYAWGNTVHGFFTDPWYNGNSTAGYQYEEPKGEDRYIYGRGSPQGVTMPGAAMVSGKSMFRDMDVAGIAEYRSTGSTNWTAWNLPLTTWTPTVEDAASGGNVGSFTGTNSKYSVSAGVVTVSARLDNIDTTGMTAGNVIHIRGFPIDPPTSQIATGALYCHTVTLSGLAPYAYLWPAAGNPYVRFGENVSGAAPNHLLVSDISSGVSDIWFTLSYIVS